jgi:uncharacterized protein (DUF488 family)
VDEHAADAARAPATTLVTVGHGTAGAEELVALLRGAGVERLVDVRTAPGSRRHPHFSRPAMEEWVPAAGISYRWEQALGGFRRPAPDSPNVALRHPAFRGYADYMATPPFDAALRGVLAETTAARVAVMCAESLWWRCHRRLVADATELVHGVAVRHLMHDGRLAPHRLTEGARLGDGIVVYDPGETTLPLGSSTPEPGP